MPTDPAPTVRPFRTPETSFSGVDAHAAAAVVATAADIAVVVGANGVVLDVAFGAADLASEGFDAWIGRPWADTVTSDGKPKIEALLSDAAAGETEVRWRQVNHQRGEGTTGAGGQAASGEAGGDPSTPAVPVVYVCVAVGDDGRVVAIGRDLRPIAALQQRLVEAQRSMERDYSRLRQAETRYRLLFQLASEAVLIVNDTTGKVVDANPAALEILARDGAKRPNGRSLIDLVADESRSALQKQLAAVGAIGRAEPLRATLADTGALVDISASIFRQDSGSFFLVRLTLASSALNAATAAQRSQNLIKVVESAPEAFVVTDLNGVVLTNNAAFLELTQLASDDQIKGQTLDRWLGRHGVDLSVIVGSLREHGSLRFFATTIRGEHGAVADVELSAVSVPHGDPPCLGFMIRNVGSRPRFGEEIPALPKSVEQLTELVGRVPLKDIVRETTDVIERLCIEAALELTGDNRASAAEMLGLSRQSLYVKLRRYGLGDLEPFGEA